MNKLKIIYFLPFVISTVLVVGLSIWTFELIISDVIIISIILFLISGLILSKGYILGNIIGIIPAFICTYFGLQDNGQWINEIVFAVPVYIFYIICFIVMTIKMIIKNKKLNSENNEKITTKLVLDGIFVAIVFCVMVCAGWWCFGFNNNSSIEHYNIFAKKIKLIPETTEIGEYINLATNHYQKNYCFTNMMFIL